MDFLNSEVVDDGTAELILKLQIEDLDSIVGAFKGKARENDVSDTALSMQLYRNELEDLRTLLKDRHMTQSIASAVQTDGEALQNQILEEDRATQDRNIAQLLDTGSRLPLEDVNNSLRSTIDEDLLEKLAALYVTGESQSCSEQYEDAEEFLEAESSTWASSRKARKSNKSRKCVVCHESKLSQHLVRLPCNEEYCRECLVDLFKFSLTDESLFPPRCCRQNIPVEVVSVFLLEEEIEEFKQKKLEYETPNKTYCSMPNCSTFVPAESIVGDTATCPKCEMTTCTICKSATHKGDCPKDTALLQVLNTATQEGWQRCQSCWRIIELEFGCHHMTCPCGAQFCYNCGQVWKTCDCEQWDAHRLFARANQIVDRDPPPVPEDDAIEVEPNIHNTQIRADRVQRAMEYILENHECEHARWRFVQGQHVCEECHDSLPQHIFECRQCRLRACNRCKKNRL